MITIYGINGPHVGRLREALIQKGLKFQHVSVNLAKRSQEFRDLTLTETMPVMDDEGTIVMDSIYALDYLDRKYPKTYPMLGKDDKERTHILNIVAAVDKISDFMGPLYVEKFNMSEGMTKGGSSHRAMTYNDQQKKDLQKDIDYRLGKIKAVLGKKHYFTSQFSTADAALLGLLGTIGWLGMKIDPQLKSWSETLMKDPKIAQMNAPQTEKGIKEI